MKKDKRGIAISVLLGWIIGITILAIVVIFAIVLKDNLFVLLDKIKSLFRR